MLGMQDYQKIENIVEKKMKKYYHGESWFAISDISICRIGEKCSLEDCLITISIQWGIGDAKDSHKAKYTLRPGLKNIKQVSEALYTIIEFVEDFQENE